MEERIISEPVKVQFEKEIIDAEAEAEFSGDSDADFLKKLGLNVEVRTQVRGQLEEHFGDRVFSYKQYSGTVTDMMRCPVFYDKLEEGFDAAVAWLEENDQPLEDENELEDSTEPEVDEPAIDSDANTKEQGKQPENRNSPKPEVAKVDTSKGALFSAEVDKPRKPRTESKELKAKQDEPKLAKANSAIIAPAILETTTEVEVQKVEEGEIKSTEAITTLENVQSEEAIEVFHIPASEEVAAEPEVEFFSEPLLKDEPSLLLPKTEEKLPEEYEVKTEANLEPEPVFDVIENVESDTVLDEQFKVDQDGIEPEAIQEEQPVPMQSIETIVALIKESPDIITEIAAVEIQRQAVKVIEKIDIFTTLWTAEECKEALAQLRGELELLLLQLGYADAREIAIRLTKQYDVLTLKQYIVVLARSLQTTQKGRPGIPRRLKNLLPYHRYGTHAVRTVVSYA